MQTCFDCGEDKPLVKFSPKINGKTRSCTACDKARRQDSQRQYQYRMFLKAFGRCESSGRDFTITMQDIDWPSHCPVFGTKFSYSASWEGRDEAASLDRIDNSLGYIPGNVMVMSTKANRMKNSATKGELRAFAQWVLTEFD